MAHHVRICLPCRIDIASDIKTKVPATWAAGTYFKNFTLFQDKLGAGWIISSSQILNSSPQSLK